MRQLGSIPRVTTRRRFLTGAAALAVAGRIAPGLCGEDPKVSEHSPLPIIDTHQHLWDLSRFHLAWLAGNSQLGKSFLTADYLKATDGLNVVKAVYMEVDVDPDQQRREAEYVIGLCRSEQSPTVAAVISGRPDSEDFAPYIQVYRDSPYIKGVRQVLHAASAKPGLCLQERFVRSMRLLGELGMRFDLCMRPAELADGTRLADLCPDTNFVLDHCGNADPRWFGKNAADAESQIGPRQQWLRDLSEMAKRKNIVCKISGI
ncbi:MAG: amidohydrolase family protein, partial [Planctomycetes bacterium]|nr:amidohydrolase family protein [Planctomycetota bacterium]